jgi:hypothetical protein
MASRPMICDCARITDPELATIDALARLNLAVRQRGGELVLRHANAELLDLIWLAGLADVLGVEMERKVEQREQPGSVEEEGELGDLTI